MVFLMSCYFKCIYVKNNGRNGRRSKSHFFCLRQWLRSLWFQGHVRADNACQLSFDFSYCFFSGEILSDGHVVMC